MDHHDLQKRYSKFYSNKAALEFISALRQTLGENGVLALLRQAQILPDMLAALPNTHEKGFAFLDFSALNEALENIYGQQGLVVLAHQAAKASFVPSYGELPVIAGTQSSAFRELPLEKKCSLGLQAIAKVLNETTNQRVEYGELEDGFELRVRDSAACWGRRRASKPACHYLAGLIRGGLAWITSGEEFPVLETQCTVSGAEHCVFWVRKQPYSEQERSAGKTGFLSLPPK